MGFLMCSLQQAVNVLFRHALTPEQQRVHNADPLLMQQLGEGLASILFCGQGPASGIS